MRKCPGSVLVGSRSGSSRSSSSSSSSMARRRARREERGQPRPLEDITNSDGVLLTARLPDMDFAEVFVAAAAALTLQRLSTSVPAAYMLATLVRHSTRSSTDQCAVWQGGGGQQRRRYARCCEGATERAERVQCAGKVRAGPH